MSSAMTTSAWSAPAHAPTTHARPLVAGAGPRPPKQISPRSVARVVLERDPEPDSVLLDRAVLDHDILSDDLGDTQVAHRFRRGLDRAARGRLPGLAAHADHLGDPIHPVSHHNRPLLDVGGLTLAYS